MKKVIAVIAMAIFASCGEPTTGTTTPVNDSTTVDSLNVKADTVNVDTIVENSK